MNKNLIIKKSVQFIMLACIFVFIIITVPLSLKAQCSVNTSTDICSGGNGELPSNASINTGMKHWWNSSSGIGTRTSINFGGGILVVCGGSLTISSGSFINGTIIVMGGTLTFDFSPTFYNTFTIVNYSTINFNGSITLSGVPARVFNNSDGIINVTGTTTLENNSAIINNSEFTTNNLTINNSSGPALCQEASATTSINADFTNNLLNSIQSPGGSSCVYIGNDITINQNVSPDSDLYICDDVGGNDFGPANWGSANVSSSCNSCASALPIELIHFSAQIINSTVFLTWETASEFQNNYFTVERSANITGFEAIDQVDGAGNSSITLKYNSEDKNPYNGVSYYRLKQTDFNGQFEYSQVISVNIQEQKSSQIEIHPNPTTNQIIIKGAPYELEKVALYDILGKNVTSLTKLVTTNDSQLFIDLSKLKTGIYYVRTKTTVNKIYKE